MGTTREESGLLKVRNRPPFPLIYYPIIILSTLTGFALGSNAYTETTINKTLKLCNERPLECKFKYDILRYHETGAVPYKESKEPAKTK
jgi:hypothetical protein